MQELAELERAILLLQSQIAYLSAPLTEVLESISWKAEGVIGEIFAQAAAEVNASYLARLKPPVSRHKTVLRVHTDCNFIAVFADHFFDKWIICDRHRAENHASGSERQVFVDGCLVADAAADFYK